MTLRGWYLALAVVTIPLGMACRMAPLGLPAGVVKYGGSALWAVMVYWLVCVAVPRMSVGRKASIAGVISVGVEFFKLVHAPALDAFRLTLAGKLVLGRFFGWWDIVAYVVAIGVVAWVDRSSLSPAFGWFAQAEENGCLQRTRTP
jgi:hypothetical protein